MKGRLTIYIDQVDSHVHMRVFFNHGLAGKLTVRAEEFFSFLDEFSLKVEGFFAGLDWREFEVEGENLDKLRRLAESWYAQGS